MYISFAQAYMELVYVRYKKMMHPIVEHLGHSIIDSRSFADRHAKAQLSSSLYL